MLNNVLNFYSLLWVFYLIIYLYRYKAFDVFSYHLLLDKLRLFGICRPHIYWIADFLIGRVMKDLVSGICSRFMDVRSGVPQGSVLCPLLFLLFVNNLPTYVISECKFFADDMKIYLNIRHSNIVDMSSDLSSCQRDFDTIVHVTSS